MASILELPFDTYTKVVELLEIDDLFAVALRIKGYFHEAARERIQRVRPTLERLMNAPFNFRLRRGLALTHISLSGKRIGDFGVGAVAAIIAMRALANLELLDLSDNRIGDGGVGHLNSRWGMVALAGAMGAMGKLLTLDLGLNKIGDMGITEFSRQIANGAVGKLQV